MQNQLNNTLLNVRKAYRLLFEYQDRIKNLIAFIGGHYDFEFREGYPVFSAHAKNGTRVNLDHWAWDWLGMYFYHFKFAPKNDITFSIFILNDSGYYDVVKQNETASCKLKPETFSTVDKAETKLFLVIGKRMWKQETKLGNWEDILFQDQHIFTSENDGRFLFKAYTLENFMDEGSAISTLKDFQLFCQENQIFIQLKERDLQ
ncbi:hypothetical protein [Chryseobacterium sp.]|uniref:hypothetical protein n=1 Tax=Chryseobacterium sp. TaxID=1871047 RepID=UPI00289746C3|nr:hypothetical protein [Chryseobacterium sp.]